MKRILHNRWFLAVLGGIIPALAWPPLPSFFLLFVALVPLFKLEDLNYREGDRPLPFFFQVYTSMLLWNIISTFWVWNASPVGSLLAFFINALLFTMPWLAFHQCRKFLGGKIAYPAFFAYWIAIEYLHFNWDLAWPWLALGNAFAAFPEVVQWYEYTGVLGGTLWVLAVNYVLYRILDSGNYKRMPLLVLWLGIPAGVSFLILQKRTSEMFPAETSTQTQAYKVAVVQPNIDPFSDKFGGKDPVQQIQEMIALSEKVCDSSTRLILWPETAITENLVEENLPDYESYRLIQKWLEKYPTMYLLTGSSTFHFYGENEEKSLTAREYSGMHYDAFNTALFLKNGRNTEVYHKSKLVPGVEKMPYPRIFGFLEKMAIDLDGTSGSLGKSDSAVVFHSDEINVAPIICYESVFGEYVTEFVKNGADVLCIITNDGWWKDTPGYKQHFQYARLRAVETRKYIARSANTGVSGFIDPLGKVNQQTGWWVPAAISETIRTNDIRTFYVLYGDYIGKAAALAAIALLAVVFIKRKTLGRKGGLRLNKD